MKGHAPHARTLAAPRPVISDMSIPLPRAFSPRPVAFLLQFSSDHLSSRPRSHPCANRENISGGLQPSRARVCPVRARAIGGRHSRAPRPRAARPRLSRGGMPAHLRWGRCARVSLIEGRNPRIRRGAIYPRTVRGDQYARAPRFRSAHARTSRARRASAPSNGGDAPARFDRG